ncbi:PDZ domain-containing protein [Lentisalinibacter sediminis]|uniref:PDZ domain-containing protein n=1 Tax=Lentisalinibacter sediminis TaxID=2992237 RepID=UPI0038679AF2
MKTTTAGLSMLILALGLCGRMAPAAAQESAPEAEREEAAEQRIIIREERHAADQARSAAETERLHAAEERLAEAAREIAEITSGVVPGAVEYARGVIASARRPVLGVSIGGGSGEGDGPVEGVEVLGVSPGSAAAEAGIRAGDVLTAIDGESLAAEDPAAANRRLLGALAEREPGDSIDIELRRDSRELVLGVKTRDQDAQAFTFFGDGGNLDFDFRADAPMAWFGPARPWGDMELVELSPGLGRYFGTDSGLLVVRAPSDPALKLEDGDVIRRIGGREPGSVSHAIRILRSYEEGEELELEIMREKRSRKLAVQIPASQGRLAPLPRLPSLPGLRPPAAAPERTPAPPPQADFGLPEV